MPVMSVLFISTPEEPRMVTRALVGCRTSAREVERALLDLNFLVRKSEMAVDISTLNRSPSEVESAIDYIRIAYESMILNRVGG